MKQDKARVIVTICSIAAAGMVLAACGSGGDTAGTTASAECTRDTLQKLADTYVSAQRAGEPTMLPLAANASYAENDTPTDITQGVLAEALTVDFTRSLHDTTQCATFTELVAATHPHPYVIHTR